MSHPPCLRMESQTHAISIFSSVSNYSRPRLHSPLLFIRSPVESECKDTTIFQTDKIFFQKKITKKRKPLETNSRKQQLFFSPTRAKTRRTAPPPPSPRKFRPLTYKKKTRNAKNQNISLIYSNMTQKQHSRTPPPHNKPPTAYEPVAKPLPTPTHLLPR